MKNETPHYGLKEHASVDVKSGLVLATTMTPASVHDSNYLQYLTLASCHSEEPIKKVYADKGYHGEPNRSFLYLNEIEDGIMRKDTRGARITQVEIKRNNKISKKRYIVEQYFGLSHLYDGFRLVEPTARREHTGEVHDDDKEHLGRDVQTDGVQPISWIETAGGDIGEISTRGMGFG